MQKYQIKEEIYSGLNTVIYRGYDRQTSRSVIVKTIKSEQPTLEEIASLKQEYSICQLIDFPGVVRCYDLEKYRNGFALIQEDCAGQSLQQLVNSQPVQLKEFLRIAISLAETLSKLPKIPLIHKDINPSNIIIDTESGAVKIIDFGIASRLTVENPSISHANVLEGTPAYMSPEQTGRMNRSIDYRTDLYSLGATFYEMLTGTVPFPTNDLIELVHSHLVKQPIPPHLVRRTNRRGEVSSPSEGENIPQVISDIVMKLLAKNAEDRYQSATGLKFDLELCLLQLEKTGRISNFTIAQRDRGDRLLIPQKLYGREAEVETLLAAFERISDVETHKVQESVGAHCVRPLQNSAANPQSKIEMILVSGYSGIGKTSVVNEVHKPIVKARGYFISGKFDQFKRNIPYSAFIDAFDLLIRQLLGESDSSLTNWREKLLEALEINAKIIIDLIPSVELIIGKQPELPELGATETEKRLLRVWQKFVGVFAQPSHPLVLFLDDLQWADAASLKLLQTLVSESDCQNVLIIGAYRDNEVSPTHPLIQAVEKIEASGTAVSNLVLESLAKQEANQLIADTFNNPEDDYQTKLLADLLFNKTQGNPFFINQLLKTLYADNLLVYDLDTGEWQWDIEAIQKVGITDYGIVELIAKNIGKLKQTTQQILKLAACLGNQFNLEMLAIVNRESPFVTASQLWEALSSGLILPLDNAYKISLAFAPEEFQQLSSSNLASSSYKFLHDRVQQAAYSLIPTSEKKSTHCQIGKMLLANTSKEKREENIFALVNQLNFGTDLLSDRAEKDELAELNLIASKKAKEAAAYETAASYVNVGLDLIDDNSWEENYDLTLALHTEATEAEYLNTNFDRSQILAQMTIDRAKTLLEKVKIYEIQIQSYAIQNKLQQAIEMEFQVLQMLGVELEQEPAEELITADLANLPEMTDPNKLAALRILDSASSAAYIINPPLLFSITLTMVNICSRYGNSPLAAISYINYAFLLSGMQEDFDSGYKFGQLALQLLEKFDAKNIKSIVLDIFNGHIKHWQEHLRETIDPLLEAVYSGLETGELVYSGYAATHYCANLFLLGEDLESVDLKSKQYLDLLQKNKQQFSVEYLQIWRQLIANLSGRAEDKSLLIGEAMSEAEILPIWLESNNGTALFAFYIAKAILLYFWQDYPNSLNNAKEAEKYAQSALGLYTVAEHNFYYSLALLAQYSHEKKAQQKKLLSQIATNQAKMQKWASLAPANFQHKYELVEAEKARVLGENWQAGDLYDRSIQGAQAAGFTQQEALANERAGLFYLACGKEKIAWTYLNDAYYGYMRWGAVAKVRELEGQYPQFLAQIRVKETVATPAYNALKTTVKMNLAAIDFASVLKASQAISQEIVLDRLLDRLMQILLENAGAQTGFLLLSKEGKLTIEVTGSIVRKGVITKLSIPLEASNQLPLSVINYVARTLESVVLDNTADDPTFAEDLYLLAKRPLSLLCVPILKQNQLVGIAYLENNSIERAFNRERQEISNLLCTQAAISLKNAILYRELQQSQMREKAERQIRKALEKEKEFVELKSRFISTASHEFRTPLTTILGTTELLRRYGMQWSEEKKQGYFDRIETNVLRMTNLLDDVLVFSKAEAGKLEFSPAPLNLLNFCQNLVEEFQEGANTKQTIIFASEGQCTDTQMDAQLLQHILSNLLSNAIKYSPAESTIDFQLTCQEREIIFQVRDRGIGIPEKDREKLFESFHRASNVGTIAGTGLGLSIVKRCVDAHQGNLKVQSQVGVGTTFIVTIPR
jgi:predicted ATPase/signal transduction histidine kinase